MAEIQMPNYTIEQHSLEAVGQLKQAAIHMSPRFSWQSSDGEYTYLAISLDTPGEEELNIGDMPVWRYREVMNSWRIMRLSRPDEQGNGTLDIYTILAGFGQFASRYDVNADLLADPNLKDYLNEAANAQVASGRDGTELIDYAIVDNALFDLEPVAKEAMKTQIARQEPR